MKFTQLQVTHCKFAHWIIKLNLEQEDST